MSIRAIDRAIQILNAIGENKPQTLSSLSSLTNLPISTVSRIIDSLKGHGFVEQDNSSRSYRLGQRILFLSKKIVYHPHLIEIARPILEDLSRLTGEDAGISVFQGNNAIVLDKIYGVNPLKIVDVQNQDIPLYCGAHRKVILAHQPIDWVNAYLNSVELVKYTENTLNDRKKIILEIDSIKKNGFAISFAERLPESAGVSAPIWGIYDEFVGAIFVMGPKFRFNKKTVPNLIKEILKSAKNLTFKIKGLPVNAENEEGGKVNGNL
jgi:DNA-binding IclR family transcriptional regulator